MNGKEYKIKIFNEEHCKEVQDVLFKLGYGWARTKKQYKYLDSTSLYLYEDFSLAYMKHRSHDFFNQSPKQEITLQELIELIPRKERNDNGECLIEII